MAGEPNSGEHELVIIRRRHDGEHEGHHGGVWKIAYADFMTAMMAFFLVMWLINATNEKTRASVASYFNPMKLADTTANPKGLSDPKRVDGGGRLDGGSETKPEATEGDGGEKGAGGGQAPRSVEGAAGAAGSAAQYTEQELFADPYAVLSEIAGRAGPDQGFAKAAAEEARGSGDRAGMTGGEAYRDPFDPSFWPAISGYAEDAQPGEPADSPGPSASPMAPAIPAERPTDAGAPVPGVGGDDAERAPKFAGKPAAGTASREPAAPHDPSGRGEQQAASVSSPTATDPDAVAAEILRAIEPATTGRRLPQIEVTATGEGFLVSLTDDSDFGMFAIGSAEPRPEVVAIMEKIAGVLASRTGAIVIRGHTDGRPFRSRDYDNWRLSTARAHMAQYMLVRGGLDEARIERLEGYADRALRKKDDPDAAENRRIEILLREDRP
ncbi:MotB family protein [Faunimonas sp. B44]|uniref:MotB family protein n=1 Tax=Faunimonas sp. B44 TaxID=3461493 RepID=UPI0040444AD2